MNGNTRMLGWMAAGILVGTAAAKEPAGTWTTSEKEGRIEARHGDTLVFAWQEKALAKPKGGEKFAASAFLHPLRTPSGFEWTAIQPSDHLHHFGLWWPWKHIEVNGGEYNCWEVQAGQGALVAKSVKTLSNGPDGLEWEFVNETVIKKPGTSPLTAIYETARVGLKVSGDAEVLDISIRQKAADSPVTILKYRYSGFSWRGPLSWNKDNSTMTTSEGKDRDHANDTSARWVVVSGPSPTGSASVLMMSAAAKMAGTPENLRVWDSKMFNGNPFVNFNPVMKKSLPLDDAHPAVSNRKYRVIAADHVIDAAEAEAEWKKWLEK
jgi:hypothetical protein